MAKKDQLYDMRIVGLSISEGKISQKDYNNYIKKLKDVTNKSETLIIDEEIEEATDESTEEHEEIDEK
ncbi:MAG: hypothetical protein GTO02_00120 [Candidatus Dadabacteria bacterium]|nr:hypothetical protein [Candidatus Dadabacteria bacterium]NIQ12855.1 hypothetical protein [Candidatus Dadabacteria bacterium]